MRRCKHAGAWLVTATLFWFGCSSDETESGTGSGTGGSATGGSAVGGETSTGGSGGTASTGGSAAGGGGATGSREVIAVPNPTATTSINGLGCDDTSVFLTVVNAPNPGASEGELWQVPLTGGSATVLDTAPGLGRLLVDGPALFYSATIDFGEVELRRWQSGGAAPLSPVIIGGQVAGLASTATDVYMTLLYANTSSAINLHRLPKAGGAMDTVAQATDSEVVTPKDLRIVDDTAVFIVNRPNDSRIWSVATSNQDPFDAFDATDLGSTRLSGLDVHQGTLFVGLDTGDPATSGIHTTTVGSTSTQLLVASGLSMPSATSAVLTDETHVYWTDYGLWRASLDGGGAVQLHTLIAGEFSVEHVAQCDAYVVFSIREEGALVVHALTK